jgi:DMSO reductase anchor subunit
MKPVFSVILFTVSSGAGLGLLALLVLLDLATGGGLRASHLLAIGLVAMVLVTVGLVSSTFHLANPKNAWRAVSQFKRSWLSREGVFALLLYPAAIGYLGSAWLGLGATLHTVLGLATLVLAWATLFCTGMIYACLKTIPRWHSPLVPLNYMLLGHFSGALVLLAMRALQGGSSPALVWLALALLIAAAAGKIAYYAKFRRPAGPTLGQAIGATTAARAKLLDQGHTHGTFLTNEFGFRVARERAAVLRWVALAAAFAVPVVVLLFAPQAALVAVVACLGGLFVERWLFFAEAQHVVRLYHGQQRV